MHDPTGLKRLWLAVVGTALLVPLAVEGRDAPQVPPGSGRPGWIVGELRPFAFGPAGAKNPSATLSQLHQLGWLECTGQPLVLEDFPELHEAIRDTWGRAPKGTFLLPDLRGFFLRGWQTTKDEETYRQLMGGDLIRDREDEPPARLRPENAEVTYFIYAGRDVSRIEQIKGVRGK